MFVLPFIVIAILVVMTTLTMVVIIEMDNPALSSGFMIIFLTLYYFMVRDVNLFVHSIGWVKLLTQDVPIYIGLGVVVALLKWLMIIFRFSNLVAQIKADMGVDFDPSNIKHLQELCGNFRLPFPANKPYYAQRKFFQTYANNHNVFPTAERPIDPELALREIAHQLTPRASKQIGKISSWVFVWPFVIIDFLLTDSIKSVAKFVAWAFDATFGSFTRSLVHNSLK